MTKISLLCDRGVDLDYDLAPQIEDGLEKVIESDTEFQILLIEFYELEYVRNVFLTAVQNAMANHPEKSIEILPVNFAFEDDAEIGRVYGHNTKIVFTATDDQTFYWHTQFIEWVVTNSDIIFVYAYDYLLTINERRRLKLLLQNSNKTTVLLTNNVTEKKLLRQAVEYPDDRKREIFFRILKGETAKSIGGDFGISSKRVLALNSQLCYAIKRQVKRQQKLEALPR